MFTKLFPLILCLFAFLIPSNDATAQGQFPDPCFVVVDDQVFFSAFVDYDPNTGSIDGWYLEDDGYWYYFEFGEDDYTELWVYEAIWSEYFWNWFSGDLLLYHYAA